MEIIFSSLEIDCIALKYYSVHLKSIACSKDFGKAQKLSKYNMEWYLGLNSNKNKQTSDYQGQNESN